jgi:deoxyribodipyrimidine photo-lyase
VTKSKVPAERIILLREGKPLADKIYVLYWMQTTRRVPYNFALEYAIERANELKIPLIVYQGLTYNHPWASDRFHQFFLEGIETTRADLKKLEIPYFFYLQKDEESPDDVFENLTKNAALIVTDDFPCFVTPSNNSTLAENIQVPSVAVDSNGVVPLRCFKKQEYAARTIRPKILTLMKQHFQDWQLTPLIYAKNDLEIHGPWTDLSQKSTAEWIAECQIDHSVKAHPRFVGGRKEGLRRLKEFLKKDTKYSEQRNQAGEKATSELSPYLHYGYISALEVALAVHTNRSLSSFDRDAFLEELVVRRELAFNYTLFNPHYDKIEGLPDWAQKSLADRRHDKRPYLYTLEQFEKAQTHDDLWNGAQTELVVSGKIHGYLRMIWGKKIIEWSASPEEALEIMIQLNNKYALDGRDPNSYTGFQWCLGLHDRPWIPNRPVFGNVRYMSSSSTKKKIQWQTYLKFVSELVAQATNA